jgi:hypothetical protein
MTQKGLYKYYEGLPPWGKGVFVVGVGLGAYLLFKVVSDKAKQASAIRDAKKTLQDVNNDLRNLQNQGVRPSYSESQYKIYADGLFTCFDGWGTCAGYMVTFQQMNNDADVLKLIQAYGVRTIPSGKFNPIPDFTGTLPQALRDELQTIHIMGINNILKNKGIKYQF